MPEKILISTSSFAKEDSHPITILEKAGYEVVFNPYSRKLKEKELLDLFLKFKPIGLIAGVEPITANVLEKAFSLRVISRCGVGLDNIDLKMAEERDIAVFNTPEAPTKAVAELTVALIIICLRNIVKVNCSIQNGKWDRPMGRLLEGKTLGIIGCGRIGIKVAQLLKPFDVQLLGYDISVSEHPLLKMASLELLLEQSDIVTLHLSCDKPNYNLVDDYFLKKMKYGSILINTSRGELVDENALYDALVSNQLSAAAIDVFKEEPYKGKLNSLSQVVLTSHIGSYAKEARIEMEKGAVLNLVSYLKKDNLGGV